LLLSDDLDVGAGVSVGPFLLLLEVVVAVGVPKPFEVADEPDLAESADLVAAELLADADADAEADAEAEAVVVELLEEDKVELGLELAAELVNGVLGLLGLKLGIVPLEPLMVKSPE